MPTELFIRRPLLWLQFASRKRATILCSPNFGYRHYLKVLGRSRPSTVSTCRRCGSSSTAPSRSRVELCDEFLTRLAPAELARTAMFPVYGLAEASLAVSFPHGRERRISRSRSSANHLASAAPRRLSAQSDPDAVELMCDGQPSRTAKCSIAGDDDAPLPDGHSGPRAHPRRERHARLFREPGSERRRLHGRWLAAHRRPRPRCTRASCTSPAAPRRSSSSTARTITRTTSRPSRSARRAWSSARWSRPARSRKGEQTEKLVVFVLHRGGHEGLPAARHAGDAPDQRAHRASKWRESCR